MENQQYCAVLGQHPVRFLWGFDEVDKGRNALKMELVQKIVKLRQQGVTRVAVDYADMVLAVYNPAAARGDAVDQAIAYAFM